MKGQFEIYGQRKQAGPGGLTTKFVPWNVLQISTDYIANIYNMRSLIKIIKRQSYTRRKVQQASGRENSSP